MLTPTRTHMHKYQLNLMSCSKEGAPDLPYPVVEAGSTQDECWEWPLQKKSRSMRKSVSPNACGISCLPRVSAQNEARISHTQIYVYIYIITHINISHISYIHTYWRISVRVRIHALLTFAQPEPPGTRARWRCRWGAPKLLMSCELP